MTDALSPFLFALRCKGVRVGVRVGVRMFLVDWNNKLLIPYTLTPLYCFLYTREKLLKKKLELIYFYIWKDAFRCKGVRFLDLHCLERHKTALHPALPLALHLHRASANWRPKW